ncbi:TPA: GNAT family N-acetyltransferase [Escherichia coli]
MIELSECTEISKEFEKIAWNEFFVKRNRGISLQYHYPFLYNKNKNYVNIIIKISGVTVGGLILQFKYIDNIVYGSIGLVCIKDEYRGLGLFNKLFIYTLAYAKKKYIHKLILWTSKHSLYEKFGFRKKIQEYLYIEPTYSEMMSFEKYENCFTELSETNKPPFVKEFIRVQSRNHIAYLFQDANGISVYEYKGKVENVLDMIKAFLSKPLRILLSKNDDLFQLILKEVTSAKLIEDDTEMWYTVDKKIVDVKTPHIAYIDRI